MSPLPGKIKKTTFINSKEDLNRFLQIESKRYGRKSTRIPLFAFTEKHLLWKHNVLLRKAEYYTNNARRLRSIWYRYRLGLIQVKYCLNIPLNVFDCGLKIMHLAPLGANSKSRVGKNCTLHKYSSLAAGGVNDFAPCLGDDIIIGIGAIVLGQVTLANGIAVGANAVVSKSFLEENITIAGVPAKKIGDKGQSAWTKETREKHSAMLVAKGEVDKQ